MRDVHRVKVALFNADVAGPLTTDSQRRPAVLAGTPYTWVAGAGATAVGNGKASGNRAGGIVLR